MDKIKIDLGFATLVAERGADKDYREVIVSLEDKKWSVATRHCSSGTKVSL